jgi:hypothetical protein
VPLAQCSTGVNLSVFRTLRLVRLLYTIPSPSLRELLGMMMRMADSTVAVFMQLRTFAPCAHPHHYTQAQEPVTVPVAVQISPACPLWLVRP